MNNVACKTCVWWGAERAHRLDWPLGTCHVQPPLAGEKQVLPYHDPDRPAEPGPLVTRGMWPWTVEDDWCGKHQDKGIQQDDLTDPDEVESDRGPVAWASDYAGLSVSFLNRARLTGDGPPYLKLGRRVVYERAALDAWLASRRRRSTSSYM